MRNFRLSDDIIFRFSNRDWTEWPITTEKFVNWLNQVPENEEVVNLFLNYETLGEQQREETGIFDFFYTLPGAVFSRSTYNFSTPGELSEKLQPVAPVSVLCPISWADEEKDLTAWLGNELQDEAFGKLYGIEKEVMACGKPDVIRDWERLQTSDHFYYMCTKWFSDGEVHKYFNPYDSPYEAFINYMNVLSDFIIRVKEKDEPAKEAKPEKRVTKPKTKAKAKPKNKGKAKPTTKVAARKPSVKKATATKPKKKN